ncbi:2-C-methyl-D-erythritol 4-phosphate cytidylyltransferase [Brachybacterium sp. GCM10030252]|uniref:IspD/TarI family cytidylyltransferase n=1 Tax=Brachybacterium sp. GCM10030252 TaxID=3273380 RepID=UPI00360DE5C3
MPDSPTTPPVRPIVLARTPLAPGASHGAVAPCLEMLGGSRLIERLLTTLEGAGLSSPVVVAPHDSVPALRRVLGDRAQVLASDGDRCASLSVALAATTDDLLLIHDAERALTPATVVTEVLAALGAGIDAVVPVVAMTDSVKGVDHDGLHNIDRSSVAAMQSPRLLRRATLERALARPEARVAGETERPGHSDGVGAGAGSAEPYDEILAALADGAEVRTVHGSHAGFAVVDRLSLWRAQIALGLARDTSQHHGLARRS